MTQRAHLIHDIISSTRTTDDTLGRLLGRLQCPGCKHMPLARSSGNELLICPACGSTLSVLSRAPLIVRAGRDRDEAAASFEPPVAPRSPVRAALRAWHDRRERRFALRIPALPEGQLRTVRDAVERFGHNPRVLDVGGGAGRFHEHLSCPGDYTIVDILEPDPLRLDSSVTYVIARAEALPLAEGAFDVVLLIEVLEHLPDPGAALTEIARVLARSGLIILTTRQAWRTHGAPHDYFRYTRYGLERLLTRVGLAPETMRALGGPASVIAATLDNNLPLFGKPVVKQFVIYSVWRLAAWLDRTAFRANVDGPAPETTGWLVVARRV